MATFPWPQDALQCVFYEKKVYLSPKREPNYLQELFKIRYNVFRTRKPAPLRLPCVIYYASSTPADTLLFDAPHESLIIVRSVYNNNVDY